jgi:hypothetical protein
MASSSSRKICILEDNETIRLAAEELAFYLARMTDHRFTVQSAIYYESETVFWIGTFGQLPVEMKAYKGVEEGVYIATRGLSGIISGPTSGSVLMSVYRYLTELGCRWLAPGEGGEYVPQIDADARNVKVIEKPSYKIRGVCIEGAVSVDNIVEMVRWLPKVGLNSYFIQFREAYIFFKRWYEHRNHPVKESKDSFAVASAREYVRDIVHEMKLRGLTFHAVGHGWTCEPFGIPGVSWDTWDGNIDPSVSPYFALVNGERKLWEGVPLNTSICFANEEARDIIAADVCRYAIDHPEVDILHVWLSDGANNQCECEMCLNQRPSDQYVTLLNEIDAKLSANHLNTKIVFLLYWDTLWPPETEKLINVDRFILMFAPITRSYRESYPAFFEHPETPAYKKNRLEMPETVEGNLSFLYEWMKQFNGEMFLFDYHLMWAHHKDPGYRLISRILHEDISRLEDLGLHGLISCQVQRSFFPNGLAMVVTARTLWDKTVSLDEIADDYYKWAYGTDWITCKNYLNELSELYYLLEFSLTPDEAILSVSARKAEICSRILDVLDGFKADLAENRDSLAKCQQVFWKYLGIHYKVWCVIASALRYIYSGNGAQSVSLWTELKQWLWEHEDEYQNVFDVFDFIRIWDVLLEQKKLKS